VLQTANADADEVEGVIRRLADEFVRGKGYLRERWK
jgi:hypothetical protein